MVNLAVNFIISGSSELKQHDTIHIQRYEHKYRFVFGSNFSFLFLDFLKSKLFEDLLF